MKKIFVLAFLTLFLGTQALAAGLVPCGGSPSCCESPDVPTGCSNDPSCEPRCQLCHFFVMGKSIIDTVLIDIIPPIAILFVIIGGTYFILGSGYDPSLISKAKAIFWSITIGLLIIYGSWLVINLFFATIGVQAWTGLSQGWWQINCP